MAQMAGGMMSGMMNNSMSQWRETLAREENYRYGESAARNADARTRALYWDLQSPAALLEQYKKAGLSPSMMFSGGGVGAQPSAGAQGTGAGNISPNVFPMSQMDVANIRLANAQAEKIEEETNTIKGSNERGRAEIDGILQSLKNSWLDGEMKSLDVQLKNFEVAIKGATGDTEIAITKQQYENLITTGESLRASLQSLVLQNKITEESADAIIEYNKQRVIEQQADILLKRSQTSLAQSGINLNKAQIEKLLNDIVMDREAVRQRGEEIEISRENLQARVEQWAKENGFTEKAQWIKIADIFIDTQNKGLDRVVDIFKAIIPFAKPIKRVNSL